MRELLITADDKEKAVCDYDSLLAYISWTIDVLRKLNRWDWAEFLEFCYESEDRLIKKLKITSQRKCHLYGNVFLWRMRHGKD